MSHPDVFLDHNRCILCGRCVRVSQELDHKNVFQFVEPRPQEAAAGERRGARRDRPARDRRSRGLVPGRRADEEARGLRGAGRRTPLRRSADWRRRRSARREAPRDEATHRDRQPRRLLRLPHVDPRHRRAHPAAGRAGRVRPLADQRLQGASAAAAPWASSKAGAATRRTSTCSRTSASTATCWSRWGTARSTAACRRCATTSRCASASRRRTCESPGVYNPGGIIPNDPEIPLLLHRVYPVPGSREDRLLPPRVPAAGRRDLGVRWSPCSPGSPSSSRTPA